MRNLLSLMVIKVGQKGMLLKINHTKGQQLKTAAVKWLYLVRISEPQRNKKKIRRPWNLHDLQGKTKLNKQLLKSTGARKITSEWIFGQDSNTEATDALWSMGTTSKTRMRNKTNGNFYCIWFLCCITCIEGTISLSILT